jgi:hypothetical protein
VLFSTLRVKNWMGFAVEWKVRQAAGDSAALFCADFAYGKGLELTFASYER